MRDPSRLDLVTWARRVPRCRRSCSSHWPECPLVGVEQDILERNRARQRTRLALGTYGISHGEGGGWSGGILRACGAGWARGAAFARYAKGAAELRDVSELIHSTGAALGPSGFARD